MNSLRTRSAWLFSALSMAVPACSATQPSGKPADAVEHFFTAVAAGDCAAAQALLATAYRAEFATRMNCDAFLSEMREYPLEKLLDTQVDGRNRDAQLVRTRLRGRKSDIIIRVQAESGHWKIFAL